MNEPTFLILTVLASGPKHGYAMMREVEKASQGRVTIRAGTLYTLLDRLNDEGLITLDREELVNSRLRRYYRITSAGATRLADEVVRLRANASAALKHLRLGGLGT